MSITSKVDICNLTAGHLKQAPITSIDPPVGDKAEIFALYYDQIRQSLLQSYDWSFARKRAIVSADPETPAFGWAYMSSPMPSDYIKLISLQRPNSGRPKYDTVINTNNEYFELENNRILTNLAAPYYIKYTRDVTIVNEMDKLFITALSYLLALATGSAIGISTTLKESIRVDYEKMWKINSLTANGSHTPPLTVLNSPYINVRNVR